MQEKILVTPRSLTRAGHPSLARLRDAGYEVVLSTPGVQPDEEELVRTLPDCVGYLAGVETVSARSLEAARSLKVISRNGTGVDSIDLVAAERCGIRVLRAEGANARGVAELAIGLTLALVRSIPYADKHMKASGWERRKGIELHGRTMGLVGCGKIGKEVTLMAMGMGMRVIAHDPYLDSSFAPGTKFRGGSPEDVWSNSDVISLHCPPPPDGKALITEAVICEMKQGVYLVNTARGDLLDDQAVLAAVNNGRISGVAMDAFRQEPPGDDPLVKHERVIASPHIGAFTTESVNRAVDVAVDNMLAFLAQLPRRQERSLG